MFPGQARVRRKRTAVLDAPWLLAPNPRAITRTQKPPPRTPEAVPPIPEAASRPRREAGAS